MIYINCPSCEAHGRVPDERMNTAIVCKKCLKTFHVKSSGHAVAGGPPIEGRISGQTHEFDHRMDFDEWLEKINETLHKLVPIATVTAVVAIVVIAFMWVQPPLEDRVATVATALARGDQNAIRGLAVEGTDDAAVKWLEEMHPQVSESIQATPSVVPIVTIIATQGDPQAGEVVVRARISPEMVFGNKAVVEGAPESKAVMARSIDVPLMLESGIWSGWRLNGKGTLKAFQKQTGRIPEDEAADVP